MSLNTCPTCGCTCNDFHMKREARDVVRKMLGRPRGDEIIQAWCPFCHEKHPLAEFKREAVALVGRGS